MFGFVAQLILTPNLVPGRHRFESHSMSDFFSLIFLGTCEDFDYINREESSIHRVQIGPRRKVTNSVKALTVCAEE